MVLILTNDDGIDAPGIQALQKAVGGEGMIVAPMGQLSGCGHQVTTSRPLQVSRRSENALAVGGTPADCTRLAVRQLYPGQIDWVLSGINAGANLGVDVYISGTVAAVREAAIFGVPAIAISQWVKDSRSIDWEQAAAWTEQVLGKLYNLPLPLQAFWNVNLPSLAPGEPEPELVFCPPSTDPHPVKYRTEGDFYQYTGRYEQRDYAPGSDVAVCFGGNIAITQITL